MKTSLPRSGPGAVLLGRAWPPRAVAAGFLGLAALALSVPAVVPSYWLTILTLAFISAIEAIGLNLLMGYTGLDSLGQAAFFGLGSYGLGILTVKYGLSWGAAAGAALALGTAGAALLGLIAVRLKGLYFLLVTAAMGQVLWGADYRWGTFTGGANGLELGGGRPAPWFYADVHFYYLVLAVFAAAALLAYLVIVSPFGLTLKGIREREVRSQTLGYGTYTHKLVAFVLAGLAASVAGILNAAYTGIASPSDLSLDQSFGAMLMVILGGAGTVAGPVLGALVLTALQYELSTRWATYWPIILGGLFIAATVALPQGIAGLWRRPERHPPEEETPSSPVPLGRPEPGPEGPGAADRPHGAPVPPAPGPETALELSGLVKMYGDLQALAGIDLRVSRGERVGIIGLNGAGKTTLFHVISGIERPSRGRVILFGRDVTRSSPSTRALLGLSRTFQVTLLYPRLSVLENMEIALLGSTYRQYRFQLLRPLNRYGDLRARAEELLRAASLWGARDVEVRHLSYGHQRQLEIAMALAPEPKVLLLDEPTAGLAQAEIAGVRRLLAALPRDLTVLVVEHHLEVIFEFVDRVVVLHQGAILADGPPEDVRADPRVRDLYLGRHAAAHAARWPTRSRGGGPPC